jgi:triacylglycerol lipase
MSTAIRSSFGLDPALAARLRELGPSVDPAVIAQTRALFTDRLDLDMPAGGARHYDVAYGDHARQKLDICAPPGRGRPVVLFVPGGGFTGGDKSTNLHVPSFFAREGFVGVAMNYRLAPECGWPAGAQDVAAALDWIADYIGDCAGDPRTLFVVAQSAGAAHASAALFDPRFQPSCLASVRAAVLMSGIYRIEPDMPGTGFANYFGEDATTYEDRSPLSQADRSRLPLTVTTAELDPPMFAFQSAALVDRSAGAGNAVRSLLLEGHNHLSPVLGLVGEGDGLGKAIVEGFNGHL